jgi:hypothetical protein
MKAPQSEQLADLAAAQVLRGRPVRTRLERYLGHTRLTKAGNCVGTPRGRHTPFQPGTRAAQGGPTSSRYKSQYSPTGAAGFRLAGTTRFCALNSLTSGRNRSIWNFSILDMGGLARLLTEKLRVETEMKSIVRRIEILERLFLPRPKPRAPGSSMSASRLKSRNKIRPLSC